MLLQSSAHAGGFEIPDNGTEALGRGGAFVAKADDATALEYNVAGFAQQRGTRIMLDANLILHDEAFTRAGSYAGDPMDPRTPYAGQPYPTVHDASNVFPVPFLGFSTDAFGLLRRWTFAIGFYGPHSPGQHNYNIGPATNGTDPPATVQLANGMSAPGPARYDIAKTDLVLAHLPEIAAAYHASQYLDVGVAVSVIYAQLALSNASETTINRATCPQPDYAGCDAYAFVNTTGVGFAATVSALAHPTSWLDVGLTYRTPGFNEIVSGSNGGPSGPMIKTSGKLKAVTPNQPGVPKFTDPFDATFETTLPMTARLGGRLVSRYADGSERADVELDLTWENWSAEKADHLTAPDFPTSGGIDLLVQHNYKDTFGVRVGGAYNIRVTDHLRITPRLGLYYDSASTDSKDTRLDFNTFDKLGVAVGAGVRWRGLTFNLAYAYVWSPDRTVTDSANYPLNSAGMPVTTGPAVGNGHYVASTQILSAGLTVHFNAFK